MADPGVSRLIRLYYLAWWYAQGQAKTLEPVICAHFIDAAYKQVKKALFCFSVSFDSFISQFCFSSSQYIYSVSHTAFQATLKVQIS